MTLSRNDFEVLAILGQTVNAPSANELDSATGLLPSEVDDAWDSLLEQGFIENGRITPAGVEALEPFRVKNAIIQAAGTCSRFSPLSYDIPKGMLKVRGERMIERMIRQLHEAGIYDITMIVGHKKEMYAYLGAKFGVRFVENPDYAITNTCRSLWCAREYLGRTYLLFSDTYFLDNPFKRYVWEGFYMTAPVEGHTDEWLFVSNDDGFVCDMVKGGDSGEYMGGFCCFDEAITGALVPLLDAAQESEAAKANYWEDVWYRNFDKVHIRSKCLTTRFLEFDSMGDLKAYDPDYLVGVNSPSLDFICSALRCSRDDIHDCYMLTKGLTNHSCHFAVGEREYVFRMPARLDGRDVDYANETRIEMEAKRLGVDHTFVHEDPTSGRKISRFIPNVRTMGWSQTDAHLHPEAVRMIARLREIKGVESDVFCDRWAETLQHEEMLAAAGVEMDEEYLDMHRRIERLKELADEDGFPTRFSHNDCWFGNFLVSEDEELYLIDWENAGMAEEASDFAFFASLTFVPSDKYAELLELYLGRKPTELEYRHYAAHIMVAGLWQYSWDLYGASRPNFVVDWPIDEWVAGARNYILEHLEATEELYRKAGARI